MLLASKQWGTLYRGLKVPPGAHVIAYAIRVRISRPATENEMIDECARMKLQGLHDFDLGESSNLRNRIQRNWAGSSIYKTKWQRENYAPIFIRVPDNPVRWWVVDDFTP